jgi:hypothetical protein
MTTNATQQPPPLGVFRAVVTRDHIARTRDGCPYYAIAHVSEHSDGPVYEIRFDDGLWMLAGGDDLDPSPETPLPPRHRDTTTRPPQREDIIVATTSRTAAATQTDRHRSEPGGAFTERHRCGDVCDPDSGLPRVLDTKCGTCIFRSGNHMHLPPGTRDRMAHEAIANNSWIVCHDTLPGTGNPVGTQAICRGFFDVHASESLGCRLALALGGPIEVSPPRSDPATTTTR